MWLIPQYKENSFFSVNICTFEGTIGILDLRVTSMTLSLTLNYWLSMDDEVRLESRDTGDQDFSLLTPGVTFSPVLTSCVRVSVGLTWRPPGGRPPSDANAPLPLCSAHEQKGETQVWFARWHAANGFAILKKIFKKIESPKSHMQTINCHIL